MAVFVAGAVEVARAEASSRAVGCSKTSVDGNATLLPTAFWSELRSSTAPSESTPASISGASASTPAPATRSTSVMIVPKDTDTAAALEAGAIVVPPVALVGAVRGARAMRRGGVNGLVERNLGHDTSIIASTGNGPSTAAPSAAMPCRVEMARQP